MIAAVILAAGRSTRMGTPKLLLRVCGRTILRWVLDQARGSRCDEIVVVVGEAADRVAGEASGPGVRIVVNERYREGMGTSLAAGIAALGPECEAGVVVLGDQPGVTADAIDSLIETYRRTGKAIVASRYGTVTGAPTLIGRSLFQEARGLTGDAGGRLLIQRHPDLMVEVPLAPSSAIDVDTPEEFARFQAAMEANSSPSGSD